jgi:hypothetical protein
VHIPVPLQVPGVQTGPQDARTMTLAHLPAPSHLPVSPQTRGFSAEQPPCGSGSLAWTLAHWPLPERLQAWHVGQLLVVQHTRSTQDSPVWHSSVRVHICPTGVCEPQRLLFRSQTFGFTQSASRWQFVRQASPLALQRKAPQDLVIPVGWQLPLPSHCLAGFTVELPFGHDAAMQSVPAGYFWQAPLPSHFPSVPQLAAPLSMQRASGVLFASGLQVPAVP